MSFICRPVFSQSFFKMLCPTRHLVVSRLSFKCGLPISSDFVPDVLSRFFPSCLRFHSTPTPPSCLSLDACLHWSLFACLPVWLSTSGGIRLSGCLFFAFTCFPSCFSYHLSPDLNICLPTHPFSIISLPQRWWLILLPVCLCACLPSFVSDHVSPTSWVFPFICSPSGSVLFLFQHVFVCD